MLKGRDSGVGIEVAVIICHIQPRFHLFASLKLFTRILLPSDFRYFAVLIDLQTVELTDKFIQ